MTSLPLDCSTIGLRQAWHDITPLGQHTVGNVGRGMTSSPLDSTDGRECRACHDITALGLHARSNDVGRDMPSPPLDSTLGRTTFGVACHHCGWAAHTIERRRA